MSRMVGNARIKFLLFAVLALAAWSGCSNRAWYEGIQQSTQRDCVKNREECPAPVSYDDYRQERKENLDRE